MANLAHRLKRLEHAHRVGAAHHPCPECGRLPDGTVPNDGTVEFLTSLTGYDPEPDVPDFCTTCGRQQVLRLTFDDRG